MNKKNFALLAVLYDTEGADLYHDIYFPIIKYILATKCTQQLDTAKFYDISELQNNIITVFGIKMPLIVLKQCIKAISKDNSDFDITIYEKGQQFKIKKIWNVSINDNIDTKMDQVIKYFDQLENEFQSYLHDKMIESDKTFLDFFTDNTEDLFKYINDLDSATLINEDYLHIVRFLSELKENKIELFNIANDIFWGSCVAAFLKREVDLNIKPLNHIDYYLDSSLVMSILDLDNETNGAYAKELLDIILNSGNRVIVNSMTIKEIDSILHAVEKAKSPNPNTAISEAYYRRNLSPTKILSIRYKLKKLIEEKGLIVLGEPEYELDKKISQYKTNPLVKKLGQERRNINSENNFREIHDIYINDYIIKKRGKVQSREKMNCVFVSLNKDLIQFIKDNYTSTKITPIIHPAKVVTELWIHSSKSSVIRKAGLIEVISRCIALSNTDVRHKLRLISKYINEEELPKEAYSALYCALVDRSQKVLNEIAKITDTGDIQEGVKKENTKIASDTINLAMIEHSKRTKKMEDLGEKIDEISSSLNEKKQELESVKNNFNQQIIINNSNQEEIQYLNSQINKKEKENQNYINEIKKLKHELKIRERINKIENRLKVINIDISNLEKEMYSSIKLYKYIIRIIIESLCFIVLFIYLYCLVSYCINKIGINEQITFSKLFEYVLEYINKNCIFSIVSSSAIIPYISKLLNISNLYLITPKVSMQKIKDEQIEYWNKTHPQLNEMKLEREKLKEELNNLNKSIL